jgi:hypothetical protein
MNGNNDLQYFDGMETKSLDSPQERIKEKRKTK